MIQWMFGAGAETAVSDLSGHRELLQRGVERKGVGAHTALTAASRNTHHHTGRDKSQDEETHIYTIFP